MSDDEHYENNANSAGTANDAANEQDRVRPPLLGTEMREATLPDGSQAVVVVRAGTSQDEVDEQAARLRRGAPEAK
ncbi:hypothetical protein AB0Q95_36650 [Streptomyces sp. NPDC059900]|uniref:hypothetical protein n=1 Tax=Streptomyces sp. NPDC059900 TaxID=3155816 RepID=UPI0034464A9B